jgi:putative photosynthetic complex assembly protein
MRVGPMGGYDDYEEVYTIPVPRPLLIAAGVLVAITIAGAALARHEGREPSAEVAMVQSADLAFDDEPDGGVQVRDVALGRAIDTLPPGTNGFVRGTLRSLARERRRRGLGPDAAPMRLSQWSDGSLTLQDLATDIRIEVQSFGPTNAAAFRELLLRDR